MISWKEYHPSQGYLHISSAPTKFITVVNVLIFLSLSFLILLPKSRLSVHLCQIEIQRQSLEEIGREALFLLWGKGKNTTGWHLKAVPSSLGNWERCYIPVEVFHFIFLLQNFRAASAGIRQLSSWVWCPWRYWSVTFLLKCRSLQDSVRADECQVHSAIHMGSESYQLCEGHVQLIRLVSLC